MRINMLPGVLLLGLLAGCGHASDGGVATPVGAAPAAATATEPAPAASAANSDNETDSVQAALDTVVNEEHFDLTAARLTPDDVQFYLTVMRAAAERVRYPNAEDLAALQRDKQHDAALDAQSKANAPRQAAISAVYAKSQAASDAAMKAGDMTTVLALSQKQSKQIAAIGPLQDDVAPLDDATTQRVNYFKGDEVDHLIVQERHLDARRYAKVSAVMDHITETSFGVATCPAGQLCGFAPTAAQQAHDREQKAAGDYNDKLIAPSRTEIVSLQSIVGNKKPTHSGTGGL